jgi:DNA repair protein SbcD/Mre11
VRLVHLSDLHLGFRQFQRVTPAGINQREADVAQSFTRAIDKVIALSPDLVLIAGDVFHTVRPTNPAILHAFTQFKRLAEALPQAIVVVVAGNHDMPRSGETRCILRLFLELGFHIVDSEPRRLNFPNRDLSILAVPDLPPGSVELVPDLNVKHNVLLLHGEVEGALPAGAREDERASMPIPASAVAHERWDYVALGHYHVYRKVGPNAYYCGSLDYTSSNAWGEYAEERAAKLPGKGLIERDLASGKQTFHWLPVTRKIIDLPLVNARGLSAIDLDAAIAAAVEKCPEGIEGKVVRLVVNDVPRHVAREIDHQKLREYQRRALHFVLDTRRPDVVRQAAAGSGAPGRRPSLADTLREALRSRQLTSDIERDRLVELGAHYLRAAEHQMASRGIGESEDA